MNIALNKPLFLFIPVLFLYGKSPSENLKEVSDFVSLQFSLCIPPLLIYFHYIQQEKFCAYLLERTIRAVPFFTETTALSEIISLLTPSGKP